MTHYTKRTPGYGLLFLFILILSPLHLAATMDRSATLALFARQGHAPVEWTIALPGGETLSVHWHERTNSLSDGKNLLRTFVGYRGHTLVGSVAISDKQLSGSIHWQGKEYHLHSHENEIAVTAQAAAGPCGVCQASCCADTTHTSEVHTPARRARPALPQPTPAAGTAAVNLPEIYTDPILRVYRLAVLVDYSVFSGHRFNSNKSSVRAFWASLETYLNELYMRDVGIKFEVVQNDRLIIAEQAEELYKNHTADEIIAISTREINNRIGVENYDVGISISVLEKGDLMQGLAGLHHAYLSNGKGYAYAIASNLVIAHELGHLFGSDHTFSEKIGVSSMATEPSYGQSLMSYGDGTRDYFSLASLYYIRRWMATNPDYYPTTDRKETIGAGYAGNPVYGIDTRNRPPVIDRSRLKASYTIPKGSYFRFDIKANDPDGDSLLYMAHQADFRTPSTSIAKFRADKPTTKHIIAFEPAYDMQGMYKVPYSAPEPYDVGQFTFWLGVSDGYFTAAERLQNKLRATRYDLYQTQVNIVNGKPFRITSPRQGKFRAGERITLRWEVDTDIFDSNSRVRVLFSDDSGKTYKYLLVTSTENDGECEVMLPPVAVGRVTHSNANFSSGKGLFRIEVIDHIAHTISENNPLAQAGFELEEAPIRFDRLPVQHFTVKADEVLPQEQLTATSPSCSTGAVTVTPSEERTESLITRTWKATDPCGNSLDFVQYIHIEKEVTPLRFADELLPRNQYLACAEQVQPAPMLTVQGGSDPKLELIETRLIREDRVHLVQRSWIATDKDASPISHTQSFIIHDSIKPRFSDYPPHLTVKNWSEVPAQAQLTATDNCSGDVRTSSYRSSYTDANGLTSIKHRWWAMDAAGNEAVHEQIITINPLTDLATTRPEGADAVFYPNPVRGMLRVGTAGDVVRLTVYDLLGNEVATTVRSSEIDLSHLPTGLYWVKAETNDHGIITGRIVVERQ